MPPPRPTAPTSASPLPSFPNCSVTIGIDQTSQTFTIGVTGDTLIEPNEGFTVSLSLTGGIQIHKQYRHRLRHGHDPERRLPPRRGGSGRRTCRS